MSYLAPLFLGIGSPLGEGEFPADGSLRYAFPASVSTAEMTVILHRAGE